MTTLRRPCLIVAMALLASPPISTLSAQTKITFPAHGFSIAALEPESAPAAASTPLLMSLPPTEGFAPNVNVSIQPHGGTLDAFVEFSQNQFDQMGMQILRQTTSEAGEWFVEYAGALGDIPLHWYSRAVPRDGKIYLVTATARESQWAAVGERLRACVHTFALSR